jgi:hypothetical protein
LYVLLLFDIAKNGPKTARKWPFDPAFCPVFVNFKGSFLRFSSSPFVFRPLVLLLRLCFKVTRKVKVLTIIGNIKYIAKNFLENLRILRIKRKTAAYIKS